MSRQIIISVMLTAVFLLLAAGCASLPDNSGRPVSHAYTDTQDTRLGKGIQAAMARHPEKSGQSGFILLGNGLDAFVARAVLANNAERSIDTQYYMIHNDVVGRLFVDQLLKAADRGVRVRLLVDDIDQAGRDIGAATLDSHPNVEVRIFNPFIRGRGRTLQYVTGFGKQTRRAHNKSFTVDNQVTILGGRNIGDEYFEADPDMAFMDLDVIGAGPVAGEVSASFDQYWNSSLSYPISTLVKKLPTAQEIESRKQEFDAFIAKQAESEYLEHLRNSDLANNLRQQKVWYQWGAGKVVADDPEKLTHDTSDTTYRLSEQLRPDMAGIKKELIIFSPYFVPGKSGVAFFKQLRDRGVRVKVLTNSLASTDVSIVHAGYARYRERLLRMGVELYELNVNLSPEMRKEMKAAGIGRSKSSLHAKAFVLDREKVFIGSLNLDPRSLVQNTEIGVVFTSQNIANYIAGGFDREIEKVAFRLELRKEKNGREKLFWHGIVDGKARTFDVEPYVGFWKRFGVSLMGMLPMESQI
jgi:putative cardiolipin synthase